MAEDTVILDSGALSAIANGNKTIRVAARKALLAGGKLIVPTVVVAESTTTGGPRDTAVNRILKSSLIMDCDLSVARAAASLRFEIGAKAGTIDAIVVATADSLPGSVVLTGDLRDLRPLAAVRRLSRIVDF